MEFSQLLKGARNLDEKALGFFMEKYSPLICAFIRKKVNANDVEDATQEFFYHILKINLFAKFGGETEDAFKAYLVKSALNFSCDWRTKEFNANKRLEVFDGDNPRHWKILQDGDTVFEALVKNEIAQQFNAALDKLGEPYSRVIEMKLLDYSNAQIAEILDQPLGSVHSWYTRGLKILGDSLKDLNTSGMKNSVLQ